MYTIAKPSQDARPPRERRAFSLLELATVVAIIGLIAGLAVTRWGDSALSTVSAQGFTRSLALSLNMARRQAIAEGTPAAMVLSRTGGNVSSIQVVRAEGSGDVPTDTEAEVPDNVVVTTSHDRWEYDYTGALTTPVAGGSIGVADSTWNWDLTINALTGHVAIVKTP